jgi:hypothetical protein
MHIILYLYRKTHYLTKRYKIMIIFYILTLLLTSISCSEKSPGTEVSMWQIFETSFESSNLYDNPVQDVKLMINFKSPKNHNYDVEAFWDGEKIWRVRFQPEMEGIWSYVSSCSDENNKGLHNKRGKFVCIASNSTNSLYQHGRIKISKDGYSLEHSDGTPFFWLACTAWNGALLSNDQDWEKYLNNRKSKGFTAIQFVTTQWRGCKTDIEDRTAFEGKERITINPEFFQRLDKKFDAINHHGLLAAPVILWAIKDELGLSPGYTLDEKQAIVLAQYIYARYGAHHILWFLGGDGHYEKEYSTKWKSIGRNVFGNEMNTGKRGLATLHPNGLNWILDDYEDELWYNVIGYQSGHSATPKYSQWICEGPPSKGWKDKRPRPVINLEPSYERHPDYQTKKLINEYEVRRASYWSVLISHTSGISYGANSIWPWQNKKGIPLQHRYESLPWWEAIDLPGSTQVGYLRKAFEILDWWQLRPSQELLISQPGNKNIQHFIAVASNERRDCAFIYIPIAMNFTLDLSQFPSNLTGIWFDPRNGIISDKFNVKNNKRQTFKPPKNEDWVLILKAGN